MSVDLGNDASAGDTGVRKLDRVVIRFAGDSGDGMQLVGTQLTHTSAMFGNDISTDLIMPGAILWNHVKGAEARKAAILPNRPGWAANEVQPGDLGRCRVP